MFFDKLLCTREAGSVLDQYVNLVSAKEVIADAGFAMRVELVVAGLKVRSVAGSQRRPVAASSSLASSRLVVVDSASTRSSRRIHVVILWFEAVVVARRVRGRVALLAGLSCVVAGMGVGVGNAAAFGGRSVASVVVASKAIVTLVAVRVTAGLVPTAHRRSAHSERRRSALDGSSLVLPFAGGTEEVVTDAAVARRVHSVVSRSEVAAVTG